MVSFGQFVSKASQIIEITSVIETLSPGWCFWATLCAGSVTFLAGLLIRVAESRSLYTFATFLHPLDEDSAGGSQRQGLISSSSISSVPTPPQVSLLLNFVGFYSCETSINLA